jgi:predicted RNase H-like HicB family nuclease
MKRTFNAVIKQDAGWWIGWVQEIPGVNSQGKTRAELLKNLRSALQEALEFKTLCNAAKQTGQGLSKLARKVLITEGVKQ